MTILDRYVLGRFGLPYIASFSIMAGIVAFLTAADGHRDSFFQAVPFVAVASTVSMLVTFQDLAANGELQGFFAAGAPLFRLVLAPLVISIGIPVLALASVGAFERPGAPTIIVSLVTTVCATLLGASTAVTTAAYFARRDVAAPWLWSTAALIAFFTIVLKLSFNEVKQPIFVAWTTATVSTLAIAALWLAYRQVTSNR